MSLLRFASSIVRMLQCRLISKFTTLIYQKDTQADANNHKHSIPSWTITFFSAKQVGWFSFPEVLARPSFQGVTSWSWTVANPFLFLWILASSQDRVSFHTCLLKSTDTFLSVVHNVNYFFFLYPCTTIFFSLLQSFDSHFCTIRLQLF